MEIKAILNKPYSEKERLDFIVNYNHNKGFKIEETDTSLQALDYTLEEIKQQQKEIELEEIKNEINILDKKRIRAMAEPSLKDETTNQSWLEYYNEQIKTLRNKLKELKGE